MNILDVNIHFSRDIDYGFYVTNPMCMVYTTQTLMETVICNSVDIMGIISRVLRCNFLDIHFLEYQKLRVVGE